MDGLVVLVVFSAVAGAVFASAPCGHPRQRCALSNRGTPRPARSRQEALPSVQGADRTEGHRVPLLSVPARVRSVGWISTS